MEKINLVEILKDCPKGMELDCAIYENVELDYIEHNPESTYPIHCLMKTNGGYNALVFTHYGCNDRHPNAKCVIFPKGKTTWEGFQIPFKDGDIVAATMIPEGIWIGIFKKYEKKFFESYCSINTIGEFSSTGMKSHSLVGLNLASKEEMQKLFDAIKANGYKWNAETKTLEKLFVPKFKVGDKIRHKTHIRQENAVTEIKDTHYILDDELALPFTSQDEYELVPNKFDITTLKAFESKVLVRDGNDDDYDTWLPAIFGTIVSKINDNDSPFVVVGGIFYEKCIPYESNEHLLGTTNDCDEYFKTWE